MSSSKPRSSPHPSRRAGEAGRSDPYLEVTELIVGHLETGTVPWRCPWNRDVGRPRNFRSGAAYQGVNSILLGCRFAPSPWWLTYRQAQSLGGQVRRGESGALVVKYGTFEIKAETPGEAPRKGSFLRAFTVFNSTQIDGVTFPETDSAAAPFSEEITIREAGRIVAGMPRPPVIREGDTLRACYETASDVVRMPSRSRFESEESFHLTLFHELAHSSGHPSRLNRPSLSNHDGFGGKVYSQEELAAEMCAAFLGMEAGIIRDKHEQSAAYLSGWLSVLKSRDNRRWIVQAASQAARAADFILARTENSLPSRPEENIAEGDEIAPP